MLYRLSPALFCRFLLVIHFIGLAISFGLVTFNASAAPGPGINQVTFLASEVGTEIFNFPTNVVGAQPTVNDFQMGYLVISAAHSLDDSLPGRVSWFNFSNPRNPTLITQVTTGGNKPHMIAFYRERI